MSYFFYTASLLRVTNGKFQTFIGCSVNHLIILRGRRALQLIVSGILRHHFAIPKSAEHGSMINS